MRHFIVELAQTNQREALNIAAKVYDYSKGNNVGRQLYREARIDPFDAVPHDRALGDTFFECGYPRWRDDLKRRRESYKAPNQATR